MATCGKCGRDNPADMRFCTNCGASLSEIFSPGRVAPDSSSVETVSFKVDPQTTPTNWPSIGRVYGSPTPPISEAKKNRSGLLVGVIALVLFVSIIAVGAGIGYYYYSASRKDQANDNKEVYTTSTVGDSNDDANANKKPSPTPNASPESSQLFDPPTEPTKDASFTVYANGDWQLSQIAVVPLEKFTTSVVGIVDLAGAKAGLRAGGTNDAQYKSRRLFQDWPTGALLMRTRYADGRFSNTVAVSAGGSNGSWQNLPDERGMIEFRINDNQQQNNGGQFTVRVRLTSVPKSKT